MEIGDAAEWLIHAESELTYAKLGHSQPAVLRSQVAFHAEQAAEKALRNPVSWQINAAAAPAANRLPSPQVG